MPKRLLICGDRNWTNETMIATKMSELGKDTIIIEGGAKGADSMAGKYAKRYGLELKVFMADWDRDGKAAGPIHNRRMLTEGKPNMVWAFHNDLENSKGTKDMVKISRKAGLPARIFTED